MREKSEQPTCLVVVVLLLLLLQVSPFKAANLYAAHLMPMDVHPDVHNRSSACQRPVKSRACLISLWKPSWVVLWAWVWL
jgi:hypothetical protein